MVLSKAAKFLLNILLFKIIPHVPVLIFLFRFASASEILV
jgi:hypothetical protein